jgi:hypothetical protein
VQGGDIHHRLRYVSRETHQAGPAVEAKCEVMPLSWYRIEITKHAETIKQNDERGNGT